MDTFFSGTEFTTKRCPRRILINNPDVSPILELYRSCDGITQLPAHEVFTPHLFDAFSVIERGKAKKLEAELLQRKAEENARSR